MQLKDFAHKHLRLSLTLTLGLLAFGIANSSQAQTQILDKVIAVVNEGVVLQSEFEERKASIVQRLQGQYGQLPPMEVLEKQIFDTLILEQLQLEEAKRYGMEVSDQQINATLQQVVTSNGLNSMDELAASLAQDGLSIASLRHRISRDILLNQVQQGVVNSRIRVTEQEIDNFLESSDGKFATSPDYNLGHILVGASSSAETDELQQAQQKVDDLYQQLQDGADFNQLAIAHSDDTTALEGGNLGWRKLAQLPELFAEAVSQLNVGEVSEPLRSGAGFHLLKIIDQRGGGEQLVEQTKARHILLKTSEIMDDETAREKLLEIKQQIIDGADFADMAREHSEDIGSMLEGGDLGWSSPGMFVPAFESAMAKTAIEEITEPFKSQYGWHILQVEDRRQEDMSGVVIRNKAAQMLREKRFEQELKVWQIELREGAYLDIKNKDFED
ncbi:peptidylprolyl isomerase [Gilvimarinus agarilyticus]|uniref:peptidylprolyl isomerase n=1 Tax=unclassified Gilvimarinus TaxID=2642066 RepID=UPI001C08B114|nr:MULTISPECIES: peptidylprolyl isomerase [unclassified Gilvimarinus]MBU2887593.1 peptidylprolyl isomerase [Gilvimarinus agarilyticus]MDO6572244.1 peptidylprolyl isomerase [Gilvimarinus sp. 2_MG-2023]MDO6746811.1 peptidylprolyl isomerase [Gilvimarinus sp. 1_MG-2023]